MPKITIDTHMEGLIEVEARHIADSPLATHRALLPERQIWTPRHGWTLTHVPTGHALAKNMLGERVTRDACRDWWLSLAAEQQDVLRREDVWSIREAGYFGGVLQPALETLRKLELDLRN